MPSERAASRIVEPAGTLTAVPSIVSSTASIARSGGAAGTFVGRAGGSNGMWSIAISAGRSPSKWTSPSRSALSIAEDAVWPSPQIEASRIAWARSANRASSPSTESSGAPPASRASSSSWRTVPTRHGTHWPHDSSRKNAAIRRRASGRSAVSSNTMTTPEPSVAPAARVPSNVSGVSSRSGPDERARRAAEEDRLDRAPAGDAAGPREEPAAASRRT